MAHIAYKNEYQKEFCKSFDSLCGAYSRWNIWSDFIHLSAFAISNAVDEVHREKREKMHKEIAERYKPTELETFSRLLAITVAALDYNPEQDFLGELYMNLNLGNENAGQFFTPYHVCGLMSAVTAPKESFKEELESDGWISINDPCVGGGALLMAFANQCRKEGLNYQQCVLFVGQDIDPTVAKMAYVQLSLLGCAGYIVVGDSINEPCASPNGSPLFAPMDRETYIMPMYCHQMWECRRQAHLLKQLFATLDRPLPESAVVPAPESETKAEDFELEAVQLSLFDL